MLNTQLKPPWFLNIWVILHIWKKTLTRYNLPYMYNITHALLSDSQTMTKRYVHPHGHTCEMYFQIDPHISSHFLTIAP